MIRIDTLRKEYGDIVAVNDLSLSIEAGAIFRSPWPPQWRWEDNIDTFNGWTYIT